MGVTLASLNFLYGTENSPRSREDGRRKESDREGWCWPPRLCVLETTSYAHPATFKTLLYSTIHMILTTTGRASWWLSPFHGWKYRGWPPIKHPVFTKAQWFSHLPRQLVWSHHCARATICTVTSNNLKRTHFVLANMCAVAAVAPGRGLSKLKGNLKSA